MSETKTRKTYAERLKDPRWQRRRTEILNAADFTCKECGSKDKTLNVHHLYYESGKDPWEYPDDALKCLCEDCHELRQSEERQLLAVLGDFKWHQLDTIRTSLCGLLSICDPSLIAPWLSFVCNGPYGPKGPKILQHECEALSELFRETWHAAEEKFESGRGGTP